MRNIFAGDVNNQVDQRNVYGATGGGTTGTRGSAFTPYAAGGGSSRAAPTAAEAQSGGGGNGGGVFGKPLSWWFVLLVLLVGLMWGAQRFGSEAEQFKNVRLSVYNIVVISLAAMIGFGAFKVIFGKVRVPGLSDYIQAV